MQLHWRHNRLFAIYTEISTKLGARPFFKYERIHQELIVEFPYGYVIITPATRLQKERYALLTSEQEHGMRKNEKRN